MKFLRLKEKRREAAIISKLPKPRASPFPLNGRSIKKLLGIVEIVQEQPAVALQEPEEDSKKKKFRVITRGKAGVRSGSSALRLISLHRSDDALAHETYQIENRLARAFVQNKKEVTGVIAFDPVKFNVKHDTVPNKYFFYYHAVDPVYSSFIINKVINVFSRGGNKKRVRNIFYDILRDNRPNLSASVIVFIIQSLKPSHLNVKVRKGREFYNAPIMASDLKATIRAIKFFRSAVYSHSHLNTLREKIETEILDYLY
jgi:ribosomal protein S7